MRPIERLAACAFAVVCAVMAGWVSAGSADAGVKITAVTPLSAHLPINIILMMQDARAVAEAHTAMRER